MKGVISIVEFGIAALSLIIIFNILFPSISYEHKWEDALTILKARDAIITLDRIGKLYRYSFDSTELSNFLDKVIHEEKMIKWGETEGTFKSRIIVACNCTKEQISDLSRWIGTIKLNDRYVTLDFVESKLNEIPVSDVLIIWGYKPLSPYYNTLKNYVAEGNGIIELMDFKGTNPEDKVNNDIVQREIFGIRYDTRDNDAVDEISFSKKPQSVEEKIYFPFKIFFHIPLPLIPTTRVFEIPSCTIPGGQPKGFFSIKGKKFPYWICTTTSVWFDTDGDLIADKLVSEGEKFEIEGYNFTLSYVEESRIGIKFHENYIFDDFLSYIAPAGEPSPPGKALGTRRIPDIYPSNNDTERILLFGISSTKNYSACILNITEISRVAWLPELSKDGTRVIQDDEKLLLATLILDMSNKKEKEIFRIHEGRSVSYINVFNKDIFEVYEFKLGITRPY